MTHLLSSRVPTRSLRDREVQRLVDELLGGDDRSFALDDHTIASRRARGRRRRRRGRRRRRASEGSAELPAFAAITTALQSPPFMTAAASSSCARSATSRPSRRKWLAAWIADPLDGVHLVLVAGGGRIPSALDKAVKAHAEVVGAGGRADRRRAAARAAATRTSSSRPTPRKQIAAHLGDDAGRVPELVELLHSTYGDDASLVARRRRAVPRRGRHRGPLRPHERDRPRRRRRRARDAAPHADVEQRRSSRSRCIRCR